MSISPSHRRRPMSGRSCRARRSPRPARTPPLPGDPQPLRASGRYLLVHGWVRARHHPSTFDIEIVGGPPNATVTLYLGQRPIRDIMLDDFGRAASIVVLRSAGSTLTFRHGRRLMLEGTLPQPNHTAPAAGLR